MIELIAEVRVGDFITHKTVDQIVYEYRVMGIDEEGNVTKMMLARRPKQLPKLNETFIEYDEDEDDKYMDYDY